MNAGADVFAEKREIFTKIQFAGKFADRFLTALDLSERSRLQEPTGEERFAISCTGR